MFHNLSGWLAPSRLKVDGISFQKAAGTGTYTSETIDLFRNNNLAVAIALYLCFGAITASSVITVTINESATGTGSWVQAKTYTFSPTNAQQMFVFDNYRPQQRYTQVVTVITTANCAIDALILQQYYCQEVQPAVDSTIAQLAIVAQA